MYNANSSNLEHSFVICDRQLAMTYAAQLQWVPAKLVLNKDQFFRVMVRSKDRFYIWIYYYGSKEDATKYRCTIKVFGAAGDEECIYNGRPRSLDESKHQIIRDENALILGLGQVKRIVNKERMQCSVKMSCP
jgi:TFIIF-interacting CTD phosphatase-like protein